MPETRNEYTRLLHPSPAWIDGQIAANRKQISPHRLTVPFFIYCLAVGAVAVPKINVILALLCIQSHPNDTVGKRRAINLDDICHDAAVHVDLSRLLGYGNLLSGVLCAISSPVLGKWSDEHGRRPFIAFSAVGMFSGDAVSVAAALFPNKFPPYLILLEFIIGGLTGAFLTTFALIQSYAADVTSSEKRSTVFSHLHASMYLGLALGPVVASFAARYIGKSDVLPIFYVAGTCHISFIVYVVVSLPESSPRLSKSSAFASESASSSASAPASASTATAPAVTPSADVSYISPKGHRLLKYFSFVPLSILRPSASTSPTSRYNLPILAVIDAFSFGVYTGLSPLLIVVSEYQLHWKNFEASIFLTFTNITRAAILACILPAAVKLASSFQPQAGQSSEPQPHTSKMTNIVIIRLSLLLALISNLGFALSETTLPFVLAGLVSAAGAPASAIAQSMMANQVPPTKVGELFGAVSLLHALSRALMPATMYFIYSLTLHTAPATLFWCLGGLFGLVLLMAQWLRS